MSAAGGEALSAITEEFAAAGGKRSLSGRTQRNLAILLATLVSARCCGSSRRSASSPAWCC